MENAKQKINRHKTIASILVIALIVVVPLAGYVTASYVLNSNHISGSVNAQATLTLTANNTNVGFNDVIMITAHLNDSESNVPIQFFNGSTSLTPIINTDSSGNAIVYYNVSNSVAYDLYATCLHP